MNAEKELVESNSNTAKLKSKAEEAAAAASKADSQIKEAHKKVVKAWGNMNPLNMFK